MTISKEMLDELLKGCERPEDLLGDAGLLKDLKIKLMERTLGAELTAHLGYEEGKDAPPGQSNAHAECCSAQAERNQPLMDRAKHLTLCRLADHADLHKSEAEFRGLGGEIWL
ncbi:hypothetical protein PhaeoP23_03978 (plasmid) [Phaeobacter piscinae]|uniref:Transposase n=1 Tax=Phaeobacter piscinae TaxID=1580596 RepID=A0ABM6PJX4_9RHOB|nr:MULTISPECIES: hypothetical protein [Phaeobacter]ATG38131.1 hypothetical protein PhaeoP36_04056 [Phaeobacter piscinae]AUQ88652.1 hypothetical protein PhaeoP42_04057 [Phaeobacter piscinae]AUQ92651.1 hypothetical protein PhaeoP24_04093 [Phaeobacter inhibens]AUR26457.1 hypothetical protein PhaeoP23_03978 [Phaeobacter piscinae]